MQPTIHTFSSHYREQHGEPVGKIPLDIGVTCPNREEGGCIFCLPASFTPGYLASNDDISLQIEKGKKRILRNRFRLYFAYFQQETCTAASPAILLDRIGTVLKDKDCVGLILSTRPDSIANELLKEISGIVRESGKDCLWELGLQSAHDTSLQFLNRNHTVDDFTRCIKRIREYKVFSTGAHLLFGIPGENRQNMLDTLQFVTDLGVQHLKLHHLQVIHDTRLHTLFKRGTITLFSKEKYLEFLLEALPLIPPDVVIHRLWTSSHPDLLVAPKWNILATHLSRELQELMKNRNIWQGSTFIKQ
ncbi:TIGR01212 family radical SAM protein [Desulfopila sp. IMCC35008]|uniref:TIGR01212 family radical SAM protein n=1 Tax=Desulfopila sp. IMCC35008 TaxID=2653858 RepID=UPI0013D661FB|nr:TIGR01212 family radical SAM protein [Desulfopila sp. IMCC35008]